MGKGLPRVLSPRRMQTLLEEHGWEATVGGKHQVKMVKPGERPITLPQHGKDYPVGLTRAILKQAGLLDGKED